MTKRMRCHVRELRQSAGGNEVAHRNIRYPIRFRKHKLPGPRQSVEGGPNDGVEGNGPRLAGLRIRRADRHRPSSQVHVQPSQRQGFATKPEPAMNADEDQRPQRPYAAARPLPSTSRNRRRCRGSFVNFTVLTGFSPSNNFQSRQRLNKALRTPNSRFARTRAPAFRRSCLCASIENAESWLRALPLKESASRRRHSL